MRVAGGGRDQYEFCSRAACGQLVPDIAVDAYPAAVHGAVPRGHAAEGNNETTVLRYFFPRRI
jgi:hypothetical protein